MNLFKEDRFFCKGMILVIILGIVIRLVLGTVLKFNGDSYSWALIISNVEAGSGLYDVSGYNYSPVWGYILSAFAQLMPLIGVGEWGTLIPELLAFEPEQLAFATSVEFNFAITCLFTAADLAVAYLAYWIVKELTGDTIKAKIAFAVYLLAIHVIIISTAGAMFDSFSALLTLLCVFFLYKNNYVCAGAMFAAAALLKLFPAFLIFILVAYLIQKDALKWKRNLACAAVGAIMMSAVIMVPNIMDGHLMDSMSFIISRATSNEGIVALLMKYSSVIAYLIIISLEVVLAVHYFKKKDSSERTFVWYLFISIMIILLYPGTPQYVILLAPFLVMAAVVYDRRFVRPLLLTMVCTSMFALSSIDIQLASLAEYTDFMSVNSLVDFIRAYDDSGLFYVIGGIGGVGQYISIIWSLIIALEDTGFKIPKILGKRSPQETSE